MSHRAAPWTQDDLQLSTKPGRHFWFPARHHAASDFHSVAHWTVLHNVQRCSICEHTQHVVQVCTVCSVVWSHRILPDLLVLLAADPISSLILGAIAAQCAPIVNDHVVQFALPPISPEYTFVFVKRFVLIKLKLDCASACAAADRCDVSSFATASNCEAWSVINSRNCCTSSDVAMSTHHKFL